MNNNNTPEKIQILADKLDSLPSDVRESICWVVENIPFVEQLMKEDMSDSELEINIEKARNNHEFTLLAMLLFKKSTRQKNKPHDE